MKRILILIISLFTGSESAIMQLIYWLSSLLAYVMYLRFSMKKNKKIEDKISELLVKTILN